MNLLNLNLKLGYAVIQPTQQPTSSFSTETRRYDRKAIGKIIKIEDEGDSYKAEGDIVIYDDKNSIDFTIDGASYSIIPISDIVATFKEDK